MRKLLFVLSIGVAVLPVAVSAQSNVEGRVGKLEGEMRAVQRKVFPGGAGVLVQPDIQPATNAGPVPGSPSTGAIEDLTQRVSSLEQQLASMTGQIEQNGYKARQLQDAFDAYKRTTDARLKALEPSVAATAPDPGPPSLDTSTGSSPATSTTTRPTTRPETPTKVSTTPDRVRLVGAVEKPVTGDKPEDDYLYGYRLWQAKFYPEAEAQLKTFIAAYPKHRRASFARNLLGRSYLDDGKPSLASMAFYDNYKTTPDGERAPDSLYYLAQALMKLNKPADACKVYGELTDVYGSKISTSMKADVEKGRSTAKCQ